ncbi:MAG: PAS domain S-box protein [Chitinophagaceae bacterium]
MTSSISAIQLPIHITRSHRFFYLITDSDSHCLLANDLFNNKFNVDTEQPYADLFTKSISSGYLDKYNEAVKECIKKTSVVCIELQHRISGIECCTVYWEVSFVRGENDDQGGQYLQWTGIVLQDNKFNISLQDILEKKNAAEQARQSELFFKALIADSLDGMLLINEIGTISFSSASVVNILGYEPEDLVGKNSFDYVHPDDMDLCVSAFKDELMQAAQKKFIDIRLRQKSGEWLWCMVRGHNLLANPAVGKMLIYFCDDTFRRNAEAALIESRERFFHLIQNLNVGIVLCDAEGCILLCNQTCLEIFKVNKEEELVGRSVFNPNVRLIYEEGKHMPLGEYPVAQAIRTKNVIRDKIVGVERNESGKLTWLQINAQPVLEADQTIKHIICSFIDITEQRNLAQQFKQQEQQKQKQLMQATIDGQERERSEISRELHDNISQHLTTTRLYLEVAKDKTEGQPLEMILQAHKGLMYISNEIRRLSQSLAPPELRDIGLVESISDLCDLLKNLHAFSIKFNHQAFNEDKIPDSMKLMLFRIIQEQVNNIIRHANASNIAITLLADIMELKLIIADDGKGYDPQLIKKGLGLTNIINRVELFDGNAEVITSPGNGCFLQVRIPLREWQ